MKLLDKLDKPTLKDLIKNCLCNVRKSKDYHEDFDIDFLRRKTMSFQRKSSMLARPKQSYGNMIVDEMQSKDNDCNNNNFEETKQSDSKENNDYIISDNSQTAEQNTAKLTKLTKITETNDIESDNIVSYNIFGFENKTEVENTEDSTEIIEDNEIESIPFTNTYEHQTFKGNRSLFRKFSNPVYWKPLNTLSLDDKDLQELLK